MSRVRYRLDELLDKYELSARKVALACHLREATLSAMRANTLRRISDDLIAELVCYFRRYEPEFGPGDLFAGVDCSGEAEEEPDGSTGAL